MAVLPIRIMGDPVLHAPAAAVAQVDADIRTLVADMFETMDTAPGVGLAAPQVGIALRVFTHNYSDDPEHPWRGVVINPDLWMSPTVPGAPDPDHESEGCLSVPGERFPLRRSDHVIVTGMDLDQRPVRLEVTGWRARILQHEFDHLDGVLYIDRISDNDFKTVQKIVRKRRWGVPGQSWLPGVDEVGA